MTLFPRMLRRERAVGRSYPDDERFGENVAEAIARDPAVGNVLENWVCGREHRPSEVVTAIGYLLERVRILEERGGGQ